MSEVVLGVTGTQEGMSVAQRKAVIQWLQDLGPTSAHHGGCIGVDEEVHELLIKVCANCIINVHPASDVSRLKVAKIKAGDTVTIWKAAPPLKRNRLIVGSSTEMLVLPKEQEEQLRSGTWATYRYARKGLRKVTIIYPNGKMEVFDAKPSLFA